MNHAEPFRFVTERHLVELTGLTARTLPELLAILQERIGGTSCRSSNHGLVRIPLAASSPTSDEGPLCQLPGQSPLKSRPGGHYNP